MEIALSILLYPGLALALILGLLFGWLAAERTPFGRLRALPFSADGLAGVKPGAHERVLYLHRDRGSGVGGRFLRRC